MNVSTGNIQKVSLSPRDTDYAIIMLGDLIGIREPEVPQISTFKTHLSNFPNPFNPDTMIRFALETSGYVNLVIFDIKGSRIKTLLADEFIPAETLQEKVWNGTDENGKSVGSGIYLYSLQTAEKTWQKKMLLVK